MIIRVHKCPTFGIKKAFTKSVQYLPKLIINNSLIPVIEIGKSRYFDYEMSDDKHKLELVSLLSSQMKEIDLKPLHLKTRFYSTAYTGILLLRQFLKPGSQKTWTLYLCNTFVNGLSYLFLEHLVMSI